MHNKPNNIQGRLAQLQRKYARQLPAKIAAIQRDWQALGENMTPDGLEQLMRQCHTLAGTGTSYGFARVTEHCRAIEQLLRAVIEQEQSLDATLSQQIDHHLRQLTEQAEQAADEIRD
ncbi:Hpt domain-containing protein [Thiohalophilus thiocyanatoxydans]|uniref:Hpt domain-containing protein n=1 Tax=Thiohalophilus thiocyanatoxydans TaxID=381308 RepID=A0A4R8IST5_9GAMM|nr:Hpt domain-containing protein [Thiohalophilus thiocyanatoxydans]TDY03688.1 Hpt domain-containing protein [Thiohalophilus thiocyanatoxydans]